MENAKKQIKEVVRKYTTEDKFVDMSRLRKEDTATYRKIPHYFGSITGMLDELGLQSLNKRHTGGSLEKPSLRNQLAYDMIVELLKTKSIEQIAHQYGYSRMHVNQLFNSLKIAVNKDEEKANE